MDFCAAIFSAAAGFAASAPAKKVTFDLRRGTAQGSFQQGDVRMAGTMHAPRAVKRKLTRHDRNKKYYKTPRGRYQLARSFGNRINSNYGNLNR
jgi:hypothetical protein